MELNLFIEKLFARAAQEGMDKCEVYYVDGSSFDVNVYKGEVVDYSVSDAAGLGFRALVDGKMGYASTQAFDEEAVELLVNAVKTNAALIESEDEQFLYDGHGEYAKLDLYDPAIDTVSAGDKIAYAREMEKRTLARDARVEQLQASEIFSESSKVRIVNTLGLDVSSSANVMGGCVGPVARDGEKASSAYRLFLAKDADFSDSEKAIEESVNEATAFLQAEPMPSGAWPVVFRRDAVRSLLSTFCGVFSADNAQKDLSLLKGREGEKIAAECVTLVDDPHMAGSVSSTPFDGEGVPTRRKELISGGVLTTLMHNLKTAKKQGVSSTGNAARASYASAVGIAPTNFYIAPGSASFEEVLAQAGEGVVVTQLQGLHAGANAISGDFSLGAKGYRIRGGKLDRAVKQFTVAGNFYQLLKDVETVGADLEFGMPGAARIGAPSLLVKGLTIAGE